MRYVEKWKEFERQDKEEYCYYYKKTTFRKGPSCSTISSVPLNLSGGNNDWFDAVFRDVGEENGDTTPFSSTEIASAESVPSSISFSDHHYTIISMVFSNQYYHLLLLTILPIAAAILFQFVPIWMM